MEAMGADGGESPPKDGRDYDKKVLKIPFEYVSQDIRVKIAKLMDPDNRNDWRSLAELLGFTVQHIKWIPTRKMPGHNRGSDTLTMFEDFCSQDARKDTSVGAVMEALEALCRKDALTVLRNHLKEIAQSYEKSCRQESSPQAVSVSKPTHIKDRRCSVPMEVSSESFSSSPDSDVGANVTLDHDYDGKNSGVSRKSRLCQKCVSIIGPSSQSYTSLESEHCSRCSRHLPDQNFHRDRHNGSHSLNHAHNGAFIQKRETNSLPYEHEPTCMQVHQSQCRHSHGPERSLTYPRCKAEQQTHRRSPKSAMTSWSSTDAKMLTGPFHQATTYARVFVTYSYENNKHMQMVLSLCKCLKDNNFPCSLDQATENFDAGEKHLWVNEKFSSADFVLVCVSPKYLDDIRQPPSRHNHSLSTAHIFQLMEVECRRNRYQRVVPLLFSDISPNKLPRCMQRGPVSYRWPEEYRNLLFHLMKPESVVNQFVKSRQAKSLNGSTRNPVVLKTASLPPK